MAAAQPTFAPFNAAAETWEAYEERFECFLEANDFLGLSSSRKRAHFLNACGPEVFATARVLVAPQPVHAIPWDILKEKLRGHYAPVPSRIARRFNLRQIVQEEEESINHYMSRLRTAALDCEFRELDEALVEQLVCGVRDIRLQRRLLAKKELNLQTALEEAQAAEMSHKSALDIRKYQPQSGRSLAVNYEESSSEDVSEEETEVSRLRTTAPGKKTKVRDKFPTKFVCLSCGENHPRASCRFRSAVCHQCGKAGHIARVCRSAKTPARPVKSNLKRTTPGSPRESCFSISHGRRVTEVSSRRRDGETKKLILSVKIEGVDCPMEVDTGSSKSIVSWSTLRRILPAVKKTQLQPCPVKLRDYLGTPIPILGQGSFQVEKGSFKGCLPLIVVQGSLPSLLGLEWFSSLGLEIAGVHSISPTGMDALSTEFADVFSESLGKYNGSPISLNLDPQVAPIRLKPRRVPLALRSKVDAALDKLIDQGVLEPTDHSKWETPIVVPIKPDGTIRICGDFKSTLNKALASHPYPLPVVQHLLHTLGPASIFAKLDLAQAYQQLPVDEASAEAQTIVTHRGAFKCKRLQFGISIAPGLFQNLMERLLCGLPGVVPYFDDVLISASSQGELIERVRNVLLCFRKAGLKLKKHKCVIGVPKVEFLGFLIDANGIHPTPSKAEAIRSAPTPTCKAELQAFLGLLNFYNSFLPHKASLAEPLHRLLDKNCPWVWGQVHRKSFQAVKDLLTSSAVLVQYSPHLPLIVTADASPYGIGGVLSHRLPNGREAPVAYYSRTLSSTERNYGQIDREALAIVASVKKFHDYIYGRPFELVTDHKPLLGLLSGDRPTPQILSLRMSRWAAFLSAYDYALSYRPGKQIAHADALSRCPLPIPIQDPAPALSVLLIEELDTPLTARDIAKHSAKDATLARVINWVERGWPADLNDEAFLPFKARQHELTLQKGCLLWGHRVVVPPSLQPAILKCLHACHPGIVRMKGLGRSYVWWPQLDKDIQRWVSLCDLCQSNRPREPKSRPQEWECPKAPWSRLHLDFAGPFMGHTFLVIVDAYSRWVEIVTMHSITSEAVVRVLRRVFATHGIPDVVVSDNGPQLTSMPFQTFLASLGIRHALIAPYHPAGNGRAERAVRSAKEVLAKLGGRNWQEQVAAYLLAQHSTPCPSTGQSPAEMLMGRRLRTILDRLHPSYAPETNKEHPQPSRVFLEGSFVYAQNFAQGPRWVPGIVAEITGPCSYRVQLEDGRMWRRHVDQLRNRVTGEGSAEARLQPPATAGLFSAGPTTPLATPSMPESGLASGQRNVQTAAAGLSPTSDFPSLSSDLSAAIPQQSDSTPGVVPLRRSARIRKRPTYLADYDCSI